MNGLLRAFFLTSTILLSLGFNSVRYQCSSGIELIDNNNQSFTIKVESSGNWDAKLYTLRQGNFELVETKSGFGNRNLVLENIQQEVIYKVTVEFSVEEGLCRVRQLSGLTL